MNTRAESCFRTFSGDPGEAIFRSIQKGARSSFMTAIKRTGRTIPGAVKSRG